MTLLSGLMQEPGIAGILIMHLFMAVSVCVAFMAYYLSGCFFAYYFKKRKFNPIWKAKPP
jgi:hypothetical protein